MVIKLLLVAGAMLVVGVGIGHAEELQKAQEACGQMPSPQKECADKTDPAGALACNQAVLQEVNRVHACKMNVLKARALSDPVAAPPVPSTQETGR